MNNLKDCYIFVMQRVTSLQSKSKTKNGLTVEEAENLMIYTILREMLEQIIHDNKDERRAVPIFDQHIFNDGNPYINGDR